MTDLWFKRCPRCGTYMKKSDPQESAMCCACGWEEYRGAFYCDIVHNYCARLAQEDTLGADLFPSQLSRRVHH